MGTFLRKLYSKNEKSYQAVFEKLIYICILSEKLTLTTDKSALEKLRCHLAGGANNKRPVGLIAPPFIIGFLATENLPKVKLGKIEVGSWHLINIIPNKLCTKNKEKLLNRFWENWQNVAKQQNLTFFGSFGLRKMTLSDSIKSFGSPSAPSLGSFMTK